VSRVLVADDDAGVNKLVSIRLERRGFAVISVEDGEEALAVLGAENGPLPDFLFLDVYMPRVGGLEVLEHVRTAQLDIAVIMMTASGSEAVAIEALRHGADDYLQKPFQAQEFEAVVERTVTRQQLRRQNAALQQQVERERKDRDRLEGVLLAARTFEHELGNKLATTVGYAEMLARDPQLPAHLKGRAAEVLRGAREATDIVRQALELRAVEIAHWGALGHTTIRLPGSAGSQPPPKLNQE
jgi:DNA-binding response OmpR family regulator